MRQARRRGAPRLELIARMTQKEVAEVLGVSRARICQIETRALLKLQRGLIAWAPDGWR
jgi:RNA polymerase sigma factor (sigma-70 family)